MNKSAYLSCNCNSCRDLIKRTHYIDNKLKNTTQIIEHLRKRIEDNRTDPYLSRNIVKHNITYLQSLLTEQKEKLEEDKIHQLILHTELNDHYRKHLESPSSSFSNQTD